MTVKNAEQRKEPRPFTGSIKGQYVFLLLGLVVAAILIVTLMAVNSLDSLGKAALDIDKMAAVEPAVMDEIRDAMEQNLRSFIFKMVVPVSILILGIAYLIGMIWSTRVVTPLQQVINFSRNAKQAGAAGLPKEAPGEIGLLSKELTDMVERFQFRQVDLENQVVSQTRVVEKKNNQLDVVAHLARETTNTSQLEHLLTRSVDLLSSRFGFYHVAIFILDPSGQFAVLRSASGDAGQKMLAMRHRLKVTQGSIVGYVANTSMVRMVPEVEVDSTYFRNPLLPETRSEIALPLRISQRTIGVLDIQSKIPGGFSEEDSTVLQALADQISIAIDKMHWLQQYQETLEKMDAARGEEMSGGKRTRLHPGKVDGFVYDLTGVKPISDRSETLPNEQQSGTRLQLPLTVRGEVVATLDLWSERESLSTQEKSLLNEILLRLSQAIESSSLFEETQYRVRREQVMNQFVSNLSRSLDLDALLQQAVRELAQMPNVNEVSIVLNPAGEHASTAVVGRDGKKPSVEGSN